MLTKNGREANPIWGMIDMGSEKKCSQRQKR